MGDADRAIQDHDRAAELQSDLAEAYVNRGVEYGRKGDSDRAIQYYDRALELNPVDTKVRKAREFALTPFRR